MELTDLIQYGFISNISKEFSIYSIIIGFIIYIYRVFEYDISKFDKSVIYLRIKTRNYFNSYNTIKITGDKTITHTDWRSKQSDSYSDTFNAFLKYIDNNNFKEIQFLEEDSNINDQNNKVFDEKEYIKNYFTINQSFFIYLENDIYIRMVRTIIDRDESKDKNSTVAYVQSYSIDIVFLTFNKAVSHIKDYLNNITTKYNDEIIKQRSDKKFTYMLKSAGSSSNDEDDISMRWNEYEFRTNKSFDTLFIENKSNILKQINFFNNNEKWYQNNGNPYTLGIGLYGPPGTGKTSFIKSLAKHLNRNLIIIPLSKIYTEEQLNNAFYENKYTSKNKNSIDFSEKIICFEDIDCMSDIVNRRDKISKKHNISESSSSDIDSDDESLKKLKKKDGVISVEIKPTRTVTLSTILNLLDGIIEHPGRIIVMTSNHYDKLDPALVRPGRIDLEIEMKNASVELIDEFYNYYYNSNIPKSALKKMKNYIISPCQLVNIYSSVNNKKEFIDKILSLQE